MAMEKLGYMPLQDGAKIAVIGGGPAGSLFAHFALRFSRELGKAIDITIFDGKSFLTSGTRGCNMCAGVIARSFADYLREEGIELPSNVVQRQVEGYQLETPAGSVYLHQELEPGGIRTVYRGNGPRGSNFRGSISFDDHLLAAVKQNGAKVVSLYVSEIELPKDPGERVRVVIGRGQQVVAEEFDLVVGAFGLNSRMIARVEELGFGYSPPKTVRSIQAEVFLGEEVIRQSFGNRIYVYALRDPRIKFAAITPKYEYLTVTIVGENVGESDITNLLSHPLVRPRLPGDLPKIECRCQPRVAISPSRQPFTNRLVLVGDAADSRLYKNGLESSFLTARAAAQAAVRYGVSSEAFRKHYYTTCRVIARDSAYGKVIFFFNDLVFGHDFTTKSLLNAARLEQERYPQREQLVNDLVWNVLTGNRPYKEILLKILNPRVHF
jgi:flavin-dependent dehydrogenase